MSIDKFTENHTIKVISGNFIIDADGVELDAALNLTNDLTLSSGDIEVSSGDITAVNISGTTSIGGTTGTFTGVVANNIDAGSITTSGSVMSGNNVIADNDVTAGGDVVAGGSVAADNIIVAGGITSEYLTVYESAVIKDLEVTGTLTADLECNCDDGSTWTLDPDGLRYFDDLGNLVGGVGLDPEDIFGIQIDPDVWIRMTDDLLNFNLGAGGLRWDWPSSSGPIIMDFGNILRLDLQNLLLNPMDSEDSFTVGGIDLRHHGGMFDIGNVSIKDTDALSLIDGALTFDTGYGSINGVEWGQVGNELRMGDLRFDVSTKNLSLDSGSLLLDGFNLANMDTIIQGNITDIASNTSNLLDLSALSFDGVTKNLDITDMETINDIPFMESGGVEMLGSLRFGVGNDLYLDAGNLTMNGMDLYESGGVEYVGSHAEFGSTLRTTEFGGLESQNLNIGSDGSVAFGNGFGLDAGGDFALTQSLNIGAMTIATGGAISGSIGNLSVAAGGAISGSLGDINIASGGAITGQLGDLNIASSGVVAVGSTTFDISTSTWSDGRLKKNVKTITSGLESVLSINPVSFEWIDNKGRPDRVRYGVIAQEIAEVIPELVINLNEITPDLESDKLAVDYNGILPFLISAIQEQQTLIEDLRREVNDLKMKEI